MSMPTNIPPDLLDALRGWNYYRDKYGHYDALTGQYREQLALDPMLQAALAQAEVGRLSIEARMQELVKLTPDGDFW